MAKIPAKLRLAVILIAVALATTSGSNMPSPRRRRRMHLRSWITNPLCCLRHRRAGQRTSRKDHVDVGGSPSRTFIGTTKRERCTPTAALSPDSAANPDYAGATTAAWNYNSETAELQQVDHGGQEPWLEATKLSESTDRGDSSETLFRRGGHGANPRAQEWVKRLDLKKLAEIK
jgi:hypothetical protein